MSSTQSSVQTEALVPAGISAKRVNIWNRHTVVIFLLLERTLISFMPRCQRLALDTTCGSQWNLSPGWYFLSYYYVWACKQVWMSMSEAMSEETTLAPLATQVTWIPEESWAEPLRPQHSTTVILFESGGFFFFLIERKFLVLFMCMCARQLVCLCTTCVWVPAQARGG